MIKFSKDYHGVPVTGVLETGLDLSWGLAFSGAGVLAGVATTGREFLTTGAVLGVSILVTVSASLIRTGAADIGVARGIVGGTPPAPGRRCSNSISSLGFSHTDSAVLVL